MESDQRFWAFISYSHADAKWAQWLQRALESYRVPMRLVGHDTGAGPAPARFRPIFRDREDLAANPDLRDSVRRALAQSRFLIVVCSPEAAKSHWVEDEIVQFKRLHGESRILSVIVRGEPNASQRPGCEAQECFPPSLRFRLGESGEIGAEPAEPIAADLRPGADGRRGALLKLLAGLVGTGLDELIRRDAQRRQVQLVAVTCGALAATLVMGALTTIAIDQRNEARAQQAQAEGLIEFMLVDLRKKLEPAGRLDALDAVGDRAMAYYAAQSGRNLDADSLGRRARVLHLMGELRDKRGDLPGAANLFRQASDSTAALLARAPHDPQRVYDHAQSVYWLGYIAKRRGDLAQASIQLETYKRLADDLLALAPGRDDWGEEAADADFDLGVVLLEQNRADQAVAAFNAAETIFAARAAKAPNDRDRQYELSQTRAELGDTEFARGRIGAAMGHRLAERSILEALLARTPGDQDVRFSEAVNRVAVGRLWLASDRVADAVAEARRAATQIGALIVAAPDVVDFQNAAATSYTLLGEALLRERDIAGASAAASRAREMAERLARADPAMADWRGRLLGGARVLELEVLLAQAATDADRRTALAPAPDEARRLAKVAAEQPYDRILARTSAEADLLAGDLASLRGQAQEALRWWAESFQVLARAQADGTDKLDGESKKLMLKVRSRLSSTPGA